MASFRREIVRVGLGTHTYCPLSGRGNKAPGRAPPGKKSARFFQNFIAAGS
jgi:hypothetical protein